MSPDTARDVLTSDTVEPVGKRPMVRRTFFVPLALWTAAKDRADAEEKDLSEVLRKLLEGYVKGKR